MELDISIFVSGFLPLGQRISFPPSFFDRQERGIYFIWLHSILIRRPPTPRVPSPGADEARGDVRHPQRGQPRRQLPPAPSLGPTPPIPEANH